MTTPDSIGSTILDTGKTPAEWVEIFEGRGIQISERTLREKANRLGAYCKIGRAMFIIPEHIDLVHW